MAATLKYEILVREICAAAKSKAGSKRVQNISDFDELGAVEDLTVVAVQRRLSKAVNF